VKCKQNLHVLRETCHAAAAKEKKTVSLYFVRIAVKHVQRAEGKMKTHPGLAAWAACLRLVAGA